MSNNQTKPLYEGLEANDLARLVDKKVTVDEYKSKIGSDQEILVLAFRVQGKDPALDLVNFIEKGYEWVIDADASSGELSDGSYLVFVEIDREPAIISNIINLFSDLTHLCDYNLEDWQIEYAKPKRLGTVSEESLQSIIPDTVEKYIQLQRQQKNEIDSLKTAAGIKVETRAPVNDFTESLRIAAGIR